MTGVQTCALPICIASCKNETDSWIRINQLGYRPDDIKVAVFISTREQDLKNFKVINTTTGEVVMTVNNIEKAVPLDQFTSCYRLNFSSLKENGKYRIVTGKSISPDFRIGNDVYDGTADYLLNYMRQKRCGFNPFLNDSCHTNDGYVVYGNPDDSARSEERRVGKKC